MEALCVVCQEIFDTARISVATKCGHAFHFMCLAQWCERSTTCPQCRCRIRQEDIIKLYFNTNLDKLSSKKQSLDVLKYKLREKNREVSTKDMKIDELTASAQKMQDYHLQLKNMLSSKITDLNMEETKSYYLGLEQRFYQRERNHLKDVKTLLQGSLNDAKRILAEHVSYYDGKKLHQNLAELCAVIKQQLCATIALKDQLQKEIIDFKSCYASSEGNFVHNERQFESQKSAPKFEIVGLDSQMTPIPLECYKSNKRKTQFVVSDRELPRIPTQVPQRSLLTPATCVVPSRPENTVSSVGYNQLGGNGLGVPGNISAPELCPTRFSLSISPKTTEHESRACSSLRHHRQGVTGCGLKRPYSEN